MAKNQLKGKYVPDKDGKLRPVLKLTEFNVNLPVSVSCHPYSPILSKSPAWYSRVWHWVRNRIL